MKTYRAPGVYSKFIPSTEAVTGSSPIRKMAIVGTGQRFFNVSNQPIKRGNDKIYDEFDQDNSLEEKIMQAMDIIDSLVDKTTISFISKKAQMYTLFCVAFK